MKYLFVLISVFVWTKVCAQGKLNRDDKTIELTYEDLEQELAMKRKMQPPEKVTALSGIERVDLVFGYGLASLSYNLSDKAYTFTTSGLDIRIKGLIENSHWQIEGGFKNFSESQSGQGSASSQVLTTSLKYQDILDGKLSYVLGGSTSLHLINVKDNFNKRLSSDWSFNLMTGLRGSLSRKWDWGLDIGGYSPVSGRTLKSGVETSLMVSTSL